MTRNHETRIHGASRLAPDRHDVAAPRLAYLLRHGETDLNLQGVLQGSIDAPLNDTGRAQARAAAGALAGRGIRRIVASPQKRARHTADIVAQVLGLAVEEHPDLRERDWGVHEGRLRDDRVDHGDGVEPYAELQMRATVAFADITRPCIFPCLIVTHSGVIKALLDGLGAPVPATIGNCDVVAVDVET